MKERIVVDNRIYLNKEDFIEVEDIITDNLTTAKYTKEQVPENFYELKTLCEGIKGVEVYTGYISCHKLLFWNNGEISSETDDGEEIVYIENRTPAQMWNIIKNLIGEE